VGRHEEFNFFEDMQFGYHLSSSISVSFLILYVHPPLISSFLSFLFLLQRQYLLKCVKSSLCMLVRLVSRSVMPAVSLFILLVAPYMSIVAMSGHKNASFPSFCAISWKMKSGMMLIRLTQGSSIPSNTASVWVSTPCPLGSSSFSIGSPMVV
jgi:hypothetical protein